MFIIYSTPNSLRAEPQDRSANFHGVLPFLVPPITPKSVLWSFTITFSLYCYDKFAR